MAEILTRKLKHGGFLAEDDCDRLTAVTKEAYDLGPRTDVIRQGESPDAVRLVIEGIACRYKLMPDGRRAIVALLLPGDFCDLNISILKRMDHSIGTLTQCKIVDIPRSTVDDLLENYPRIQRSLWWATLVDEAILREWLVNMGKRRSDRQMAHLLCEMHFRLKAVGLSLGSMLPLTQEELADILGISHVHAQRVMASLRDAGLVSLQGRRIVVTDFERMIEFSEFDPDYLHLDEGSTS